MVDLTMDNAYNGVMYNKNFTIALTVANEIDKSPLTFKDQTEIVGAHALARSKVKDVICPKRLKEINSHAFYYSHLQTIKFNEKLKKIDDCAFVSTDLKELEIPKSVTFIGDMAFANCYRLKKVNIKGFPEIDGATFAGDAISEFIFEGDGKNSLVDIACCDIEHLKIYNVKEISDNFKFSNTRIKLLEISNDIEHINLDILDPKMIKKIKINLSKQVFINRHPDNINVIKQFDKDIIFPDLTLEELIDQGKSVSEINQILKVQGEIDGQR